MRQTAHQLGAGVAVAWLTVALAGCATADSTLRQRAAVERNCDGSQLQITDLGGSAYRVAGCGRTETFICVIYQGWVCTREGDPQAGTRVLDVVAFAKRAADEEAARQAALAQQMPPSLPLFIPSPPPPPPVLLP